MDIQLATILMIPSLYLYQLFNLILIYFFPDSMFAAGVSWLILLYGTQITGAIYIYLIVKIWLEKKLRSKFTMLFFVGFFLLWLTTGYFDYLRTDKGLTALNLSEEIPDTFFQNVQQTLGNLGLIIFPILVLYTVFRKQIMKLRYKKLVLAFSMIPIIVLLISTFSSY